MLNLSCLAGLHEELTMAVSARDTEMDYAILQSSTDHAYLPVYADPPEQLVGTELVLALGLRSMHQYLAGSWVSPKQMRSHLAITTTICSFGAPRLLVIQVQLLSSRMAALLAFIRRLSMRCEKGCNMPKLLKTGLVKLSSLSMPL